MLKKTIALFAGLCAAPAAAQDMVAADCNAAFSSLIAASVGAFDPTAQDLEDVFVVDDDGWCTYAETGSTNTASFSWRAADLPEAVRLGYWPELIEFKGIVEPEDSFGSIGRMDLSGTVERSEAGLSTQLSLESNPLVGASVVVQFDLTNFFGDTAQQMRMSIGSIRIESLGVLVDVRGSLPEINRTIWTTLFAGDQAAYFSDADLTDFREKMIFVIGRLSPELLPPDARQEALEFAADWPDARGTLRMEAVAGSPIGFLQLTAPLGRAASNLEAARIRDQFLSEAEQLPYETRFDQYILPELEIMLNSTVLTVEWTEAQRPR